VCHGDEGPHIGWAIIHDQITGFGFAANNVAVTPILPAPAGDRGSGAAISAADDPQSPERTESRVGKVGQKGYFSLLTGVFPGFDPQSRRAVPAGTVTLTSDYSAES
jgi:hypothetical protein